VSKESRVRAGDRDNDQRPPNEGDHPDRTPDTPTDEPKPAPVQDPPAEPGRPPLVVLTAGLDGSHSERQAMNDAAKGRIVNGERKERRGFASMSPEKQREIASKGGRAAHQKGTAHEWTSEEARSAGRKGGQISRGGRGRLIEPLTGESTSETGPAPDRTEEFSGQ
jgi:uncharacterized protein